MKNETDLAYKIRVSYFESITDKPGKSLSIEEVFSIIRTGTGIKDTVDAVRQGKDQTKVDAIKKTLPAITPSGLFSGSRKIQNIKDYSKIICLDIDDVSEPESSKWILANDSYCYAIFTSPSGKGLKVFIKVINNKDQHSLIYGALSEYFKCKYNLTVDKSCKDITRLMFLTYDKDAFINNKAKIWQKIPGDELSFELAEIVLKSKESFHSGNRNNYVYLLASACSKNGVSKTFAENKIVTDYCDGSFDEAEIIRTVNSAYNSLGNHIQNRTLPNKDHSQSLLSRLETYLKDNYDIRYNEVSTKIECRKKNGNSSYQELNENSLSRELTHANINFPLARLSSLLQSDFVTNYNPFQNYFNELPHWNNQIEPDYISKLCEYIPTAEPERFRRHFKKMLVRAIACALEDRIFNKQVFVLVHDVQNSGKSTFCRWLCPPTLSGYIAENINTDKDSAIALATNLFINMDELATLSRTELNSLKSFISKDKINVRLPYAKKATTIPRRASFIGSTNKDEFLTDETGSVRWLCFNLNGMINFSYKDEIDVNDLWRQAFTLYKEGFGYQLTPAEILENEKANSTFQVLSLEMQLIPKMFAPSGKDQKGMFLTATDIHLNLTGQFTNVKTNIHSIGRALKRLGFQKISLYSEEKGYTEKGYYVKLLVNSTT